uniref:Glycosyltransferase n=1 Tax=viral metagenome TaxID=1070528 RepID=A0A6C0KXL3_9ZZZZ
MNLVFTSAGDNTRFNTLWVSSEQTYDIVVYYYGDSDENYEKYKAISKLCLRRKGSKFQNFYQFYTSYPDIIVHYDLFFILDDDIIISVGDINNMFRIANKYNLAICQPSFKKGSIVSHGITRHKPQIFLQYTNFVEVNTPLFSRAALDKAMTKYSPNLIGWGIDFLYIWANGFSETAYAVIHGVQCINPRAQEKGGRRELYLIPLHSTRRVVWEAYADSIGCPKSFPIRCYKYIKIADSNK